jgi:hypothetical protein
MMNEPKVIATFSWDDGHPLDLRIAQLFNKYGLSCTFYVPKFNSENLPTLSASDLRKLSHDNFDIHSHTLNHLYLSNLPADLQATEIISGKKYVEDCIGIEDHIFCYPGGKYTNRTIELVKEAGFKYARTIDMGFTYAYASNNYLMPTTVIVAPLTNFQIIKHSIKRYSFRRGLDIFKFNKAILNNTWLEHKPVDRSNAPCYHFWGHSWEIEKYDLWQNLETLIQNLVASNVKILSNKGFYEQRTHLL